MLRLGLLFLSLACATSAAAYDLHIEAAEAELGDWLKVLNKRADFRRSDRLTVTNPDTGETIEVPTPGAGVHASGVWFVPRDAEVGLRISVSDPDDETVRLMKEIAAQLGGRVLGDEGEEY